MLEKLPDALGHALRGQRAGLDAIACNAIGLRAGMGAIRVHSLAISDHAPIPVPYTADGEGLSPPLGWSDVPAGAAGVVLLVEDADAPAPHPLVHAIVVGLPGEDGALPEGALDSPDHEGLPGYHVGRHSFLRRGWLPPDPPPGHGVHRYAFQVFALGAAPDWPDTPGRDDVLQALREHAIASGCLIGTYERPDGSVRDDAGESAAEPVAIGPSAAAA